MTTRSFKNEDPNLKDFVRIGPQSYILEAGKDDGSSSAVPASQDGATKLARSPDLTVLCTWLGAPSRPIAKYISGLQALYPDTPILLLRSVIEDFTFRSPASQIERTKAAAQLVKSYVSAAKAKRQVPKILYHVFSNGGSWSACMLEQAYGVVTHDKLPVTAMVIDSSPSLPRASLGHKAMMQAVPNFLPIRLFAALVIWVIIGLYYILDKLHIHESVVIKLRRTLNNTAGSYLRPGIPRTYICSKTDEMVPLEDVILHANEARTALKESGVGEEQQQILLETFEGSKHVGHMMIDAKRYWEIVQQTWLQVV